MVSHKIVQGDCYRHKTGKTHKLVGIFGPDGVFKTLSNNEGDELATYEVPLRDQGQSWFGTRTDFFANFYAL